MKFMILDRQEIENVCPNIPHLIISVTDPYLLPPNIKGLITGDRNTLGIINLRFSDDDTKSASSDSVLMNDEHVERILRTTDKLKNNIELIICQSDAGISRSVGIAIALSRILNGEDVKEDYFFEPPYMPNEYVYKKIIDNWKV